MANIKQCARYSLSLPVLGIPSMTAVEQTEAKLLELQVRLELKKLELTKTETKLNSLREDWLARVEELRSNKAIVLSEKHALEESLTNTLREELETVERELYEARESFDVEMAALSDGKNELRDKCLGQQQRYEERESSLRNTSLQLSSEIGKLCSDHATTLHSQTSKIEALKDKLEQDLNRRLELEEHFSRVDRNNAAMKLEEEKLQRIAAKEEEATQLLHQGARGLQKLFRGFVGRQQYEKLKKKGKKKGKGKKGKGGKKKAKK